MAAPERPPCSALCGAAGARGGTGHAAARPGSKRARAPQPDQPDRPPAHAQAAAEHRACPAGCARAWQRTGARRGSSGAPLPRPRGWSARSQGDGIGFYTLTHRLILGMQAARQRILQQGQAGLAQERRLARRPPQHARQLLQRLQRGGRVRARASRLHRARLGGLRPGRAARGPGGRAARARLQRAPAAAGGAGPRAARPRPAALRLARARASCGRRGCAQLRSGAPEAAAARRLGREPPSRAAARAAAGRVRGRGGAGRHLSLRAPARPLLPQAPAAGAHSVWCRLTASVAAASLVPGTESSKTAWPELTGRA